MASLTIQSASGPPTSYSWEGDQLTVGRSEANDLVLPLAGVSRIHLEISRSADGWRVVDKGSTNGTLLNGVPLEASTPLKRWDELAIGEALLVFHPSPEDEQAWWEQQDQGSKTEMEATERVPSMIGKSPAFQKLVRDLPRIAASDSTVLILGENGTGKELLARQIHLRSARAAHPFVVVNCPALPGPLLESELFGVEKGVATGVDARKGQFEVAEGGTLFLDEIGDLDASAQAKILRALQERTISRVGGRIPIQLDVRVLAATNHDLEALVRQDKFRRDLFHRLNVVTIEIPPLRERADDIALLAEHFLRGKPGSAGTLSSGALNALEAYEFPGNVRELEHIMERASLLATGDRIGRQDLPQEMFRARQTLDVKQICERLLSGEGCFWELVRDPYLKRDLSGEDARAIVRYLYEKNKYSYKQMAAAIGLESEYRKLINFLNYHQLRVED